MNTIPQHFYMGAINKEKNEYVLPVNATKKTKYKCPVCDSDILFKSGKKRMKHFCHKAKSKCSYYNERSNENPIHIEGKRLMKKLLDDKQKLFIWRKCKCCEEEEEVLTIDCYTDKMVSGEEHYFKHDSKKCFADVALIDDNETYFVFEIKNTHATDEDRRPSDKWCEIDAEDFIIRMMQKTNINVDGEIEIECVRDIRCNECEVKMAKKKEESDMKMEKKKEESDMKMRDRHMAMSRWLAEEREMAWERERGIKRDMERERERERERKSEVALYDDQLLQSQEKHQLFRARYHHILGDPRAH